MATRVLRTLRRMIGAAAICAGSFAVQVLPASADDDLGYLQDLEEMEDMINKGNLIMVPHPLGVMPVSKARYQDLRTLEILLEAKSPKDAVQQLAKLKGQIATYQRNGRQAIQEMIQETKNRMNGMNAVQATYRPSNLINKPTPKPKQNGGHTISAEELAESPPAPDADTRTLTVDSTPPPPPDGTPIIDANAAPLPHPSADNGSNDDDDAIEAAQTFIGIAGALTRSKRPRGNSGHNQGSSHPAPHPSGC